MNEDHSVAQPLIDAMRHYGASTGDPVTRIDMGPTMFERLLVELLGSDHDYTASEIAFNGAVVYCVAPANEHTSVAQKSIVFNPQGLVS